MKYIGPGQSPRLPRYDRGDVTADESEFLSVRRVLVGFRWFYDTRGKQRRNPSGGGYRRTSGFKPILSVSVVRSMMIILTINSLFRYNTIAHSFRHGFTQVYEIFARNVRNVRIRLHKWRARAGQFSGYTPIPLTRKITRIDQVYISVELHETAS